VNQAVMTPGDLLLTFLDEDRYGIKTELAKRMEQRITAGLNRVAHKIKRAGISTFGISTI